MHNALLVAAAFLASAVEMVEALTIVLAVAMTRGWRSAGRGVAAALGGWAAVGAGGRSPRRGVAAAPVVLAAIVAGLGPALANLPIDALRLVVGTVLLVFG